MLLDLTLENPGNAEADVLVVGGGTVGLILATRLSGRNCKVVVLESGGREQEGETHRLNEVVQRGHNYLGAAHGRFRCLGGTSTRWGGAMLPFAPEDMLDSQFFPNHGWGSVSHPTLMRYLRDAEALFALPHDDYCATDVLTPEQFVARRAKWPSFKSRNVTTLLHEAIADRKGPAIWLNATATGFELDEGGRLAAVTAKAPNGGQLKVRAKTTVLAAGAIESTRLLLLLDAHSQGRIFGPDDVLGRCFSDHLSAPTADISPKSVAAFRQLAGFQFQGSVMRSLRFELGADAKRRDALPAAFLHMAVIADERSGFAALRTAFRKLQRRSVPSVRELTRLATASAWLSRALWWRLVRKRLLPPSDAKFELHQVTEQVPDPMSRITLSPDRTDSFGIPLAVIDWRVSGADLQSHRRIAQLFFGSWNAGPLSQIATLIPRPCSETEAALISCGGVFHPCGSARIGSGPREGVVDGDLKAFRVPNLRVLSTAAFPRSGTANPTSC